MTKIQKFFALPLRDRALLVSVVLVLMATRVALIVLPLQKMLTKLASKNVPKTDVQISTPNAVQESIVQRLAWAVSLASQYTPGAACLVQALATYFLLTHRKYPVELRVGIFPTKDGRLVGIHAWTECQGRVVVGGFGDMSQYRLVRFGSMRHSQ